jgi:hypothetical protein
MASFNKELKTAANGKIAPQFYDESVDDYVIAVGSEGAPFYRQRGSIAMEAWDQSNPITTFTSSRYGFSIINEGTADLTFTINGVTRTVRVGETYSALFEAFTTVTIAGATAYRAEVLK